MPDKLHDHRLIIEKGGYSPDRGGMTLPPIRRAAHDGGYRPPAGGPTSPPPTPAPQPVAPGAEAKNPTHG